MAIIVARLACDRCDGNARRSTSQVVVLVNAIGSATVPTLIASRPTTSARCSRARSDRVRIRVTPTRPRSPTHDLRPPGPHDRNLEQPNAHHARLPVGRELAVY